MTDLVEQPVWQSVRRFEETDAIQGGENGVDNIPLSQLTNRTAYLKEQIENAASQGTKNHNYIKNGVFVIPQSATLDINQFQEFANVTHPFSGLKEKRMLLNISATLRAGQYAGIFRISNTVKKNGVTVMEYFRETVLLATEIQQINFNIGVYDLSVQDIAGGGVSIYRSDDRLVKFKNGDILEISLSSLSDHSLNTVSTPIFNITEF